MGGLEEEQGEGHQGHAHYEAYDCHVVVAILVGAGEQLVERDVDHYSGYGCKHPSADG